MTNLNTIKRDLKKLSQFSKTNYSKKIIENYLNPEGLNNLVEILFNQKNYSDAEVICKFIIKYNPKFHFAYNNLGIILNKKNKGDAAERILKKGISLCKSNSELYSNLGAVQTGLGKHADGIKSYKAAIQISPEKIKFYLNLGRAEINKGFYTEALETYSKAVKIDNTSIDAQMGKSHALKVLDRESEALESFQKVLKLDKDNGTAKHMIEVLNNNSPDSAPQSYVSELFDGYASNFEESLVGELSYKIPLILKEQLLELFSTPPFFKNVLDLGCGTGLAAGELKEICGEIVGVDISEKMLTIAHSKKIYDKLFHRDILEFLVLDENKYDLVIATDVLIYLGNLTPIFDKLKERIFPGTLFAFSVEDNENEQNFKLNKTGRFSHSKHYIELLCKKYGFEIILQKEEIIRQDNGIPVYGKLFIIKKK